VKEELSNLGLGDLGAAAVSAGLLAPQNMGLKELCLGGNDITDVGVAALAAALSSGKTNVRRLALRDNRISDRGAASLAMALASSSTLEELDLWGNCISEQGRGIIVSAAKSCEVFMELPRCPRQPHGSQGSFAFDPITRTVLFDWIAQLHQSIMSVTERARDPQNMLFRTYSLVDAYLAQCSVQRTELELVGLACTLASTGIDRTKKEDAPEISELANWLAVMTDGAHTGEGVCQAAGEICSILGSSSHQPTVYTFLRRYLRQTGWTEASFSLANYLAELSALDAQFLGFSPQVVAAATIVLSQQYTSQGVDVRSMPHWKDRLLRCSGVDMRSELAPCAAAMSRLHAELQPKTGSTFVHKKYKSSRLCAVARLIANPPAEAPFFEKYMAEDTTATEVCCR